MARRSASLYGVARGMARAARQIEAANRRMEREARRREKEYDRELKRLEKEEKQLYIEGRILDVEIMNLELEERIGELRSILEHTLDVDDAISFDSLRPQQEPKLNLPEELAHTPIPPEPEDYTGKVKQPTWFHRLFPGWEERHQKAIERANQKYENALKAYEKQKAACIDATNKLEAEYETALKAYKQKNVEVDEFQAAYIEGDVLAIESYNTMVLERSEYPEGLPQEFQLAYILESREVVIDYELPSISVIPNVQEYKYVKSKDEIQEKGRKVKETKELYEDILMAVTLRTIHEVFEADQASHIDTVTFSGYMHTIDAAMGKDAKPYLISVRAVKDKFNEIDLSRVEKKACLRNLGAQVSASPAEVVPVKPIVNFNKYDKRFVVDQDDILSTLDIRPNLYELSPFEFENLICNLFERMGFESKLTRSSRDGGVDAVAFDPRPILGGKVVIQAKRYKNTVGVSDVRDLWGTMDHERAHKGILVTTSGFGPDAYKFAEEKPIELIDGGGLLHLLDQVGIPAKIRFPEESRVAVLR